MIQKSVKSFLFRVLCGFFLGISVIAPGISGSIMAVMMGIYRELIGIVSNPFRHFKRNFFYLLPMGIGALASFAVSVKLLEFAFGTYPTQSKLLFMGLIAGGFLEVYGQVRKVAFKKHYIAAILAAFAIAVAMGMLGDMESVSGAADVGVWQLCLAGGVAGLVSMIPGMSVSLILMLFGVYDYLLRTASAFLSDFTQFVSVASLVGVCFITVMVLFAKVIKFVFDRYPGFAYFLVFGFMCGTLAAIFPQAPPETGAGWAMCAVLFLAGVAVSAGFQLLGKRFAADGGPEDDRTRG